jgi:glycerol-3-phosphate dehydrogenase
VTDSTFTLDDRAAALRSAPRETFDLVVIGGGVTGAGVLRDASMRGLKALLVERGDFASGTSSATSKLVHGGLRYLVQGHLGVTREASTERDRLASKNPNLVRPFPFLIAGVRGDTPLWKVRAALLAYDLLGGPGHRRHRTISRDETLRLCPALVGVDLSGAVLYWDMQTDDARIVLETVKSARRHGGEALSYAEAVGFLELEGRLAGVRVRDRLSGTVVEVRADAVVNAAGPAAERVRGLSERRHRPVVRPAKGAHVVVSGERLPCGAAVAFKASDGRNVFACPWGDVVLLGTTDTFTDEVDAPVVTADDRSYLLDATNRALPAARLEVSDVVSVYAGVRPLVATPEDDRPPSDVSREHRIDEDESGLISVAGGKLTTYRAIAQTIVDRVARRLPSRRRQALAACRTADEALRRDDFDRSSLLDQLARENELPAKCLEHLVDAWGSQAPRVLGESPASWRAQIGSSRFVVAELAWAWRHECPASLSDVLERRVRVAAFSRGQGLPEIEALARVVANVAGWDDTRRAEEIAKFRDVVRTRYRVAE